MADTTANLGMGSPNPYLGQSNPYLQDMIDQTGADMTKQFNLSAVPAFNAAMLRSGSFGNSAIDEMTRSAQDQLQKNIGNMASGLRFQDFNNQQNMYRWDQEFGRNLYNDAFGQQQANFNNGLGLLGMLNGFNQQDLSNASAIQNTPLNYLQMFGNLSSAVGNGGQTQTVNGGNRSDPLSSAIGGAMAGNRVQNWWTGGSGSNNILSTPATGYSNYDGNGGGWNAWANFGSGAD